MKIRMYVLVGAAGFAAASAGGLVSASASAEEPASCADSSEHVAAALFELPCCAPLADWPVGLMPDGAWALGDLDPCRELADRVGDVWLSGHLPDGVMMSPFRM